MENGLQVPDWAQPIFPDKLREIQEFAALLPTIRPYMKHIKGGKLITNIVTQLLQKTVNLSQTTQMYSAHDTTLVNLIVGIGIQDQTGILPGYGAALVFELYDSNGECDDWLLKVSDFRCMV